MTHLNKLYVILILGIVNVLLTTPLWVASVRLKLQRSRVVNEKKFDSPVPSRSSSSVRDGSPAVKPMPYYSGLLDAVRRIGREEGIRGLWQGVVSSLLLVFNPSIQFVIYEALKRYVLLFAGSVSLGPLAALVLGAVSKFAATLLTYPLQVVQSVQRANQDIKWRYGFVSTIIGIINQSGPWALFRGLQAKLLQTVLTSALMFVIYEQLVRFAHLVATSLFDDRTSCSRMYQ